MFTVPTLPGITSKMVDTARIKTHVLFSGPNDGTPVLFVHGNASSATYWEEIMLMLPEGFRGIAPDLRGYGDTEDKLIDATRGMGDWVDDLLALLDELKIEKAHVMGHSMGGTIVFGLVTAAPTRVLSGTVVDPGSPYGFGGCKGIGGKPCYDDFAGSGGGIVNPDFPKLIEAGDRTSDNPQASPRVVMNSFYWKPPFVPNREEDLLSALLTEKIGADKYPGDLVPSENWPNVAPGKFGPINALSPKYVGDSVEKFIAVEPKPFMLWIRGEVRTRSLRITPYSTWARSARWASSPVGPARTFIRLNRWSARHVTFWSNTRPKAAISRKLSSPIRPTHLTLKNRKNS